jgi:hypothetical protein
VVKGGRREGIIELNFSKNIRKQRKNCARLFIEGVNLPIVTILIECNLICQRFACEDIFCVKRKHLPLLFHHKIAQKEFIIVQ